MERRLLSASKVGLTFAVATLVALQSAVTVNAVRCDPHCAVKSGCLRKGPGRCDRLCVPIDIYRLNSDYRCVPRCGGNCLYCASYMNCGNCRVGYTPVYDPATKTTMCKLASAVGPAATTAASAVVTTSAVAVTLGTGSTVTVTLGTGSTVAVTVGTGTVAATTVPPVPPTTVTTAPLCHPNCSSVCTQHGSGYCDISCFADYYLTPTFICGPCDPYCNAPAPSCTSAGTCVGPCDPGYTVFSSTEMCAACSTGCTSCTSPGTCLDAASCDANSVYDSGTSSCLACDPQCTSGCMTASFCDKVTPGTCNAGYGHTVTKKCGTCDPYCDTNGCNTEGAGYCDSGCIQGYYFDSSSHTCAECQTPNPEYCQSCATSGPGSCDVCATGTLTGGVCM